MNRKQLIIAYEMILIFLCGCASLGNNIIKNEKQQIAYSYIKKMQKQIEDHWKPSDSLMDNLTENGEAVVQFKIMPDGHIEDTQIIKAKGEGNLKEEMKKVSLQAVLDASPFDPVPFEILEIEEGKYLRITFTFYYKLGKEKSWIMKDDSFLVPRLAPTWFKNKE